MIAYRTEFGECHNGDSLELMKAMDAESVDLVVTSPPFALQRKKEYGNESQSEYVRWLMQFAYGVKRILKPSGSFVIDIGGAYKAGVPEYDLYQFRALIAMCDDVGLHLAQPFYWHNPSALPAPIEWVNKRKLRAKTSVNTVWWLCKDPKQCKADITKVLTPYSDRMKKLFKNPEGFIAKEGIERPSGHVMGKASWTNDNGGAIPPNLLQISNSESNSQYLRYIKALGLKGHPARFPEGLPEFFIKMLTDEGDLVVDIFGGSCTTGAVCERLGRRWLSFELSPEYAAASYCRFAQSEQDAREQHNRIIHALQNTASEAQRMDECQ